MKRVFGLSVLTFGLATAAQDQAPTFRASTLMVPLEVTVTDSKGRACKNLEARHFKVLEDGRPQKVVAFSPKPPPVDITAVLDLSTSMMGDADAIAKAARSLVTKVRPGDRIRFVRLSGRGADPSMKAFSVDPIELNQAIDRIVSRESVGGESSPLKQTMLDVLDGMDSTERPQVVIVMSDGQDNDSPDALTHSDRVLEVLEPKIQGSFATVHTISSGGELLFPDSMSVANRERIRKMSEEGKTILARMSGISGGRDFTFSYREDVIEEKLKKIFNQIMIDITSRYYLAYSPERESDSTYNVHKIAVEIIGKNCTARTRTSYSDRDAVKPPPTTKASPTTDK